MKFEKVYLQKMDTTDANGTVTSHPVMETIRDFHMYCYDVPFNIGTEAKDLPSYDWPGENGTEEFVPDSTGIPLKSYEMEITFAFKSNKLSEAMICSTKMRKYLTGQDLTGVYFKLYSTYTSIGRQKVRFSKADDKPGFQKTRQGEKLIWKVTVKVMDPVTDITYNEGDGLLENL